MSTSSSDDECALVGELCPTVQRFEVPSDCEDDVVCVAVVTAPQRSRPKREVEHVVVPIDWKRVKRELEEEETAAALHCESPPLEETVAEAVIDRTAAAILRLRLRRPPKTERTETRHVPLLSPHRNTEEMSENEAARCYQEIMDKSKLVKRWRTVYADITGVGTNINVVETSCPLCPNAATIHSGLELFEHVTSRAHWKALFDADCLRRCDVAAWLRCFDRPIVQKPRAHKYRPIGHYVFGPVRNGWNGKLVKGEI